MEWLSNLWKSLFEKPQSVILTTAGSLPLPQEPTHEHQWERKFTSYAAPRKDIAGQSLPITPEALSKVILGVTTIVEQCIICHQTRQQEILGSENPQLDEVLDKVIDFGPQYMQRDGVTFAIQRYQAPIQNAPLPLR